MITETVAHRTMSITPDPPTYTVKVQIISEIGKEIFYTPIYSPESWADWRKIIACRNTVKRGWRGAP